MVTITSWDPVNYLKNDKDIAAYLNAAIETEDPAVLQDALGDVARAKGMASVSHDAGVGRESLYKSLKKDGNPSFQTIYRVLRSLGVKMIIEPD